MRTIDLFAGSGGMSKGFADAGYEVVAAFENWDPAIQTYKANFDHPVFKFDLSDVDGASTLVGKFDPEVIIGGPPCQDFSSAGKRVEALRADLTVAFAEIVVRVKPKFFVMENVPRARTSQAFDLARSILRDGGYGLSEMVLDASLYGAPQKRKRFFCIGALHHQDDFFATPIENLASDKPMTVREYFGDEISFQAYYRHPRNYSRRAVFSVDEPAPTMRGVNRPVPAGYPGHPQDSADPRTVRPLTTSERASIQTFPPQFEWVGARTHVEQLIGNAVPVALARTVAGYLAKHSADVANLDALLFEEWLNESGRFSTPRSAADVVSRLKRAHGIRPLPLVRDDDFLVELSRSTDFKVLSGSVRSQLRKAVDHYFDFLDETERSAS